MPITYIGIETLDVFDYGDAVNSFGTVKAANGARHRLGTPLRLGAELDPDADGQPSVNASGDDVSSLDDGDGVLLPGTLIPHFRAAAFVNASHSSRLDAWIDYNSDGVFTANEKIADKLQMTPGNNRIEFSVPLSAVTGLTTARFRLSSHGGVGPTGPAADGEVEDYQISVSAVSNGAARLLPDPFQPGTSKQMLVAAGTNGHDTIVFDNDPGRYDVQINGRSAGVFSFAAVDRIGSYGLNGNDSIIVTSDITDRSELYGDNGNDDLFGAANYDFIKGGSGNDRLFGHHGNDQLFGENGNDKLYGHAGNDILSGGNQHDTLYGGLGRDINFAGTGGDWLFGQRDDDILLTGKTAFDNDYRALSSVSKEWTSTRNYETRIRNIRSGLGPVLGGTGVRLEYGITMADDKVKDEVFGGLEADWFVIAGLGDILHDQDITETVS
jgi:Ca2+-binding RTX toxin-like protein